MDLLSTVHPLAVVRRRRRRRVVRGTPLAVPARINERWSLDFLLYTLEDGRRRRVVEVLQSLVETRGTPAVGITDNGPEFVGRALDAWAYARSIRLHFIEPV